MKRSALALISAITILIIAVTAIATIPAVQTGTWQSMGTMTAARSGAIAVLLQDHRVLIAGGNNAGTAQNSAEVFNLDGSFSAVAPMGTPRAQQLAVVLQDGRVLVAGGTTSGPAATNAAEIFTPGIDTWAPIAGGIIEARANATATLLSDGRVLIAGGQNAGIPSQTVEIFDPAAGQFSLAGTLSAPRMELASALLPDGRVLITGGSNGSAALNTTDIFDPATNTISAGPALSVPRMGHSATSLLDGRVLVAGGNNGSAEVPSAEIYDPTAGTFTLVSTGLAAPRRDHTAILLPNNNTVLILGGTSNGNETSSVETFRPWTGAFSTTGAMAVARQQSASSALYQDGLLLTAAGSSAGSAVNSAELYGFATVKTDHADYAPGTVVTITGTGWQPGETVTLTLVESPLFDTHGPFTTTADSAGNITDSSFVTDTHDVGIRFFLTASGGVSQAQNTFTDKTSTSTSLTNNGPNPSVFGQSVSFKATVSPSVGTEGCLQLFDGGTAISGQIQPTSSSATFSISTLTAGTHSSITAQYQDSGSCPSKGNNFNDSTSSAVSQTVNTASTATTVSSATDPSVFGQPVTFTATVTAVAPGSGTPTGTVQFKIDGVNFGAAVALSGGSATSGATSTLTTGPHSITGVYSGSTNFATGTSSALTQTVNQAATTTALSSATNPSISGQSVTFTATVTAVGPGGGIATGSVTFKDGATTLGTGTLNGSGVATFTTSALAIGAHPITTSYPGDTNFTGSTSSTLNQVVNQGSTTTTVVSSVNPSVFGQSVTFTATVTGSAGTPTGTVTFKDGATTLGSGALSSGQATFTTAGLSVATHSITAAFGGDANYLGSTSSALSQVVNQAGSSTALTSSPNPSVFGQTVNFTVTVSPVAPGAGTPTGTVQVKMGNALLGSGTLSGGQATIPVSSGLVTGTNGGIKALYLGDANFTASQTQNAFQQTVNQASTTTSLTSSTPTSTYGQAVTFTATVAVVAPGAGTPTGSVNFYDGGTCAVPGTAVGSATLSGTSPFQASVNTAALDAAHSPHSVLGCFVGDTNFLGSNGTVAQTVNKKPVTPSVTAQNKSYDGTTTATISTCAVSPVVGTDDVACTVPPANANFADKNVGTGKTVTATGITLSGTTAANYTLSTASATTTANTNKRAITVTAASDTKTYDGMTTSTGIPTVTGGSLAAGDTGHFTQTFDSRNASALNGRTLTPSGTITDATSADMTANYAITFATASGTINKATLTISAATNTKTYDATTSAAATPTVTGLVSPDTVTGLAEVYSDANAGAGKTLTVSAYTLNDGNGGNNYTVTTTANTTGVINKATATINVTGYSVTFDGNSHTATGSAKGVLNEMLAGLDLSGTTHTNAGTYTTDPWTFTDPTNNYNNANGTVSDSIAKANAAIAVTPYSVTYDGNAHTATGTAKGIKGDTLAGLDLSGTTHTNAGTYNGDAWTFTDATGNYNNANGAVNDAIAKALATATAGSGSATYDGSAKSPTACVVSGAYTGDLSCVNNPASVGPDAGTTAIAAVVSGTTQANFTITYAAGSYTISQAGSTTTVSCPTSVTYNGSSQMPCTATATGAGSLSQPLAVSYSNNTNAGTASASASYGGDVNHTPSNGSASFTINQAPATITLGSLSQTYDGNPEYVSYLTAPVNLPVVVSYSQGGNAVTTPIAAGSYDVLAVITDPNYAGMANGSLVINQATPVITWNDPADITYGNMLTATQLNATASFNNNPLPGTFTYNPAAGTILGAGMGQALNAHFVPDDSSDFAAADATAHINVNKATPIITWNNPADITYPTALSATQLNASVLPAGAVGFWPADENTGTVSQNVLTAEAATLQNGASWAPGRIGSSYLLNGNSQYVDAGNTPDLQISQGDFTVTAWVYFNALGGDMSMVDKMGQAVTVNDDGWRLLKQADNHFWFCIGQTAGENSCGGVHSNTVATAGMWYHVAAVKTGSAISIFVNGVHESDGGVGSINDSNSANLRFGSYAAQGEYLNGRIDEVLLFNRALMASEIQNVFTGTQSTHGKFSYTPSAGTVLDAGPAQNLHVQFTPDDAADYNDASQDVSINVLKAAQSITFAALADKTYGDADFTVSATGGGSGNTVTFAAAGNCTNSGNTIHITGAGSCTVTASQAGNSDYNPAPDVMQSFNIKKADATVVVTPYSVTFDGNPHTATVTSITGVNGESGATVGTVTLNTTHSNAGTYSTDSWSFTGAANYKDIVSTTITDTINKADPLVTAAGGTFTYDGNPHPGSGAATGVQGEALAPVTVAYKDSSNNLLASAPVNAGTYSVCAKYAGSANYNPKQSASVPLIINKADAKITVTPYSVTYDGNSHTATGTATGVETPTPADLGSLLHLGGTTHTAAGDYPADAWTFDGNSNYNPANSTVHDAIAKASATISVTPYSVTYDGNPHTATGTATGVKGEALSGLDVTHTAHTPAGTYSADYWTFTDTTGNYNNVAQTTISDAIAKANATINVIGYTVTYDGASHMATGSATGVKGEDLSAGLHLAGTTHTDANTYSDTWTFSGGTNYNDAGPTAVTDTIKQAPVTATGGSGSATYDGLTKTPSACVVSGTFTGDLSCANNPASVGPDAGTTSIGATVSGTGLTNFAINVAAGSYTINKASSTTVVMFEAGPYVYRASAFVATAQVTGAGNLSSSVAVTYSVDCTNVTVANGCTASANFAGDNNHYNSSDSKSITITQAPSTTVVSCPPTETYTGFAQTPCTALVTGVGEPSQSLTGSIIYTNNVNAGTANASASYAGDVNHTSSSDSKNFTINKAEQAIAINADAPAAAVFNTSFNLTATGGGSGNPISFAVVGGSVCSITGSTANSATAKMTGGTGNCQLTLDQAGNSNYNPAPEKLSAVTTAQKADQSSLTLKAGTPLTYNASETLTTTGGSGTGSVTYAVNSGACGVAADQLTANSGSGSCQVGATKAADSNFNQAAASAMVTLQKATQTITITQPAPASAVYNTSFNVTATASSGLTVSYSSSGGCSNSGASFTMTSGTNSCTVKFDQPGDSNYAAATQQTESVTAQKANGTVTLGNLNQTYSGQPEPATATTSPAGLAVDFTYNGSAAAPTNAGSYAVAGTINDPNYQGSANGTLVIAKATPMFTTSPASIIYGQSPTSFSGTLKITSAVPTGSATITLNGVSQPVAIAGGTGIFTSSFATSTLAVSGSPYTVSYAYPGDSNFSAANGSSSLTVGRDGTTTTVVSSGTTSLLNQTVAFTATVKSVAPGSGTPTGLVNFSAQYYGTYNAVPIGSGNLNAQGVATLNYSSLPVNANTITASYGGDGNFISSSGTMTQTVQYAPANTMCDGDWGHQILQPINADGSSVWKTGSTVPAKFRVCDTNGNSIGTGVVKNFSLYQVNSGTISPIDETADNSTNDLGWHFDSTAQQWIFNMSTKTAPQNVANRTYYYRIDLADGTSILFVFGLK